MPLKLGTTGLAGGYLGSTPIIKMYQGSNLVFELDSGETNPLKALIERTIKKVDKEFSNELTIIGSMAFQNCGLLKSVKIPYGVTEIRASAFTNCKSLSDITIPSSVKSIGMDAFNNCSSLKTIIIPDGVTSLAMQAFGYCRLLESVSLPNTITALMGNLFYACSSLKDITIPNSVTSIAASVFNNCSSLKTMTILAEIPPSLASGAISDATTTIYVPAGSKSAYENASVWKTLLTRETNPVTFVELS